MIKTVHVVFKTHLDIGFTDYSANVIRTYEEEFIPKAIALANELAAEGGQARFVWTTGSWLIRRYLDHQTGDARAKMVQAIQDGYVVWHGLPFSTHSEAMDERLFEYGLSISRALDDEFNKTTIASKMTDVPGHTIGLVPLLAKAGIEYLHIGVNPASAYPAVPPAFVWRAPDGAEVVVNYDRAYGAAIPGNALTIPGLDDALYMAHTNDNTGPPSAHHVRELFALLASRYPGATIVASTLDAFASALRQVRDTLPVMTEEIGDTWIHGIASDPIQLARLRELLRCREQWITDGSLAIDSAEYRAFSDNLLLIPEHTWGEDLKNFLPDFENYAKKDFQRARCRDVIKPRLIPSVDSFLGKFTDEPKSQGYFYSAFEKSWSEQRDRIDRAVEALEPPNKANAYDALGQLAPSAWAGIGETLDRSRPHHLGRFDVEFRDDGSIISLRSTDGTEWSDSGHPLAAYSYQTFGPEDYQRWVREYCRDIETTGVWALPDFGKIGFENVTPRPKSQTYRPFILEILLSRSEETDVVSLKMGMPNSATALFGAPHEIHLRYTFSCSEPTINVVLETLAKDANRLPEASWLTFAVKVNNPNLWMLDKLGTRVSPLSVVKNGNRNLHGIGEGLYYHSATATASITTEDAAVVAIGKARILSFDNTFADMDSGFHFNLHNNVWGTNFRMWTDDDMKYRFKLTLQ